MNRRDALYNWLQIKIVCDARPEDEAARDTLQFFTSILTEDHHLTQFSVASADDEWIEVQFAVSNEEEVLREKYDRSLAEQLLEEIKENPKYN